MGRDTETMRHILLDDMEIEYEERGAGEPLVLIHAGVFGDWFLPVYQSAALDGFRIIRVHRPGYGPQVPERHLTLGEHARAVAGLADHLDLGPFHWVGHSSSCLMGLELAVARPDLVHSLALLEPAAGGGFAVQASADLGQRFIGPAMGAFMAGDLEGAFDTFLRGVCGDDYRAVIEASLGPEGYQRAVRDSAFFFRDEIIAVQESQFAATDAARVGQPILVVEGGESASLGPLSHQITERATALLPHAEVAIIDGVNHAMPLQDPGAVGRAIAAFVRRHPIASPA